MTDYTISDLRKLNEAYENMLNEDVSAPSFDRNALNALKSFKERLAYCRSTLSPLGKGSSRIAFLEPSGRVLKLAWNRKGLAQNESEAGDYYKTSLNCFAHVYDSAEDYTWIEAETAVKCKASDFMRIFGFDFNMMQDIIVIIARERGSGREFQFHHFNDYGKAHQLYEDGCSDDSSFIYSINEYIGNYQPSTSVISDFFQIRNWGLVTRDGKEELVIVDSGLDDTVYDQYYKRS